MAGERVKVNIFDINEDVDDGFKWVDVIETENNREKIEIEGGAGFSQKDEVQPEDHQKEKGISYERRRHIRPTLDKISRVMEENREVLKEHLDENNYRKSLDNVLDRQKDRVDRISDFSKDIADEIFLSSDSFINKIKYERTKDEGREIKIEKKE